MRLNTKTIIAAVCVAAVLVVAGIIGLSIRGRARLLNSCRVVVHTLDSPSSHASGAYLPIDATPYYILNVNSGPSTVIYNRVNQTYEVKGKVELVPLGRVYENEKIDVPLDHASIARTIDAAPSLDWSRMEAVFPEVKKSALESLQFCRAVADYQKGRPIKGWDKVVDGEPAIQFCTMGRNCWFFAPNSELYLHTVGSGMVYVYLVEPSGKLRVYGSGSVKVLQTGEVCKNGLIDKDGHVISGN